MGCAFSFFDPATGQPTGWVCGKGVVPCSVCGAVSDHLCDWPMGRGKTCSAPLCRAHALKLRPTPDSRLKALDPDGSDEDLEWVEFCPAHFAMMGEMPRPKGLFDKE